ncbi:siderophore-interacting protein [Roseomonas sp. 18066]|uniref:siderophore-interacting protein n=1 Tax=Roseomonas sp. 18066 TaxID=2681412 RepID=UPI00135BDD83|nr:siderophore-interacting protein [Roseomonas sp. 18066]
MASLITEARASARRPDALIATFREHMASHGLTILGPVDDTRIDFPGGTAFLKLEPGAIALRIEAAEPDRLADAKSTVAGHLEAFAPEEKLGIVWRGAGESGPGSRPHNFRSARVARVVEVTPHMRRVTVTGIGLERFDAEMMHVKLLLPEEGTGSGEAPEPRWPTLTASGQPDFSDCALTRRTYTLRRVDLARNELDIDFVVHGDGSPGSRFAMRARPGDWLGVAGPGGGHIPLQGWTLVAGDETALPAIARALEAMPAEARGQVLIEVADDAERQPLAHPPGMPVTWLPRDGAAYGRKLFAAVQAVQWPAQHAVPGTASAWAACEAATARTLREHFGQALGLPRGAFRAAAYWRQGLAEGTAEVAD